MNTPAQTIRLFGTLGLVPFVAPALILLFRPEANWVIEALQLYAFGIISYLTGTWWLNQKNSHTKAAIVGHGLFLIAFFGLWLWPAGFFPLAALVLALLYLIERRSELAGRFESGYHTTRRRLTLVAIISLGIAQISLTGGLS